MTSPAQESLKESLLETAAAWHDRLQDEKLPEDTRRAFEAWLAASPSHAGAYAKVERTWLDLRERAEMTAILALRHETALRLTRRALPGRRSVQAIAATLAVLTISTGVLAWVIPEAMPVPLARLVRDLLPGDSRYATATGERLTATLRDGSQVTLDTDSELEVNFSKAERLVALKRGQAFFEVAKDKGHPFIVQANNRRLIAVGTAFDVRLDGGEIRVTMVEGTVRVERADGERMAAAPAGPRASLPGNASGASNDPQEITAGEQLWVDGGSRDHVGTADPERATSWRRGQLVFDGVRLGDAVAEINRYSEVKIRVADPELADVRISGSFATGRTQGFVEAVTSYFPIEATQSTEGSIELKARP